MLAISPDETVPQQDMIDGSYIPNPYLHQTPKQFISANNQEFLMSPQHTQSSSRAALLQRYLCCFIRFLKSLQVFNMHTDKIIISACEIRGSLPDEFPSLNFPVPHPSQASGQRYLSCLTKLSDVWRSSCDSPSPLRVGLRLC